MANNTVLNTGTGGDIVSDDQITTLNGTGIATGEKVQRMKLSFGAPASATDITATTPLPVVANEGPAITTGVTILQNATAATSNGTSLSVAGYGTAVLQILGTFVATINFEFSIDAGVTWMPISATQIGAGDIFQSTTIPGSFRITCTALDLIRARVTWTSGTVTINGRASNAINASKVVKLATGINIAGKFGIDQTTDGNTNAVRLLAETTKVIGTVNVASAQTIAVTNAGTFAVQAAATLAAETTKIIGTVNIAAQALAIFFNNTSAATNTTLQVLAPASGTAAIRNYITGLTYQNDALGATGNIWVLDGQGAIGASATIGVSGIFTSSAHDLGIGNSIIFTSLGTITGLSVNTLYFVLAANFSATTFSLSLTQSGAAITTGGTTSAFTFYRILFPIRLQTLAAPLQTVVFQTPTRSIANSSINLLIPLSLISGNIYLTINGYRGI